MFGFVGIVFWVLFIELGGLVTLLVTWLSLAMSRLVETLVASLAVPKSRAKDPSILPSILYPRSLYIRVHNRPEDNS